MNTISRSAYTEGLRRLADLLDEVPQIPTPEHGAILFALPGPDVKAFAAISRAQKALADGDLPHDAGGTDSSRYVVIEAGQVTYRFSRVAAAPWDASKSGTARQVVTA